MLDAYDTPFDRDDTPVDMDEAARALRPGRMGLEARIGPVGGGVRTASVRLDRLERTSAGG